MCIHRASGPVFIYCGVLSLGFVLCADIQRKEFENIRATVGQKICVLFNVRLIKEIYPRTISTYDLILKSQIFGQNEQ